MTPSHLAARKKPDTLLLLSGGLDSAFCLWQRVKEGLPTRTHHVVLKDYENRQDLETKATASILSYMDKHGGTTLITHSESKVDFGNMRWLPKNYHLWAYWAGAILADPRNSGIKNIILPRHSDAFDDEEEADKSSDVYATTVEMISGVRPTLQYPMGHLTKEQVIAELPEDLRRLCWYCRTPRSGAPCKRCRTCKQVDAAMASMVQ